MDDPNVPDCSEGDFFCHYCDASMNSERMWSSHIVGRKHIKKAKAGKKVVRKRKREEDDYEDYYEDKRYYNAGSTQYLDPSYSYSDDRTFERIPRDNLQNQSRECLYNDDSQKNYMDQQYYDEMYYERTKEIPNKQHNAISSNKEAFESDNFNQRGSDNLNQRYTNEKSVDKHFKENAKSEVFNEPSHHVRVNNEPAGKADYSKTNQADMTSEVLDGILSLYLKRLQDNKNSGSKEKSAENFGIPIVGTSSNEGLNKGGQDVTMQVETLDNKYFFRMILSRLDKLVINDWEELNMLSKIIIKAQTVLCKKLPTQFLTVIKEKVSTTNVSHNSQNSEMSVNPVSVLPKQMSPVLSTANIENAKSSELCKYPPVYQNITVSPIEQKTSNSLTKGCSTAIHTPLSLCTPALQSSNQLHPPVFPCTAVQIQQCSPTYASSSLSNKLQTVSSSKDSPSISQSISDFWQKITGVSTKITESSSVSNLKTDKQWEKYFTS